MSVVALTVPLELSDAGALIPITPGGGAQNGTIFAVDTAGYNSISIQVSGVWEAEIQFQTSNDGVNWVNTQGFAFNSSLTATDSVIDNDVYLVPVIGRYFQLVMSNYLNGQANITAYLRFQSIAGLGEAMVSQAMDNTTGVPLNVTFEGIAGPGQQPAKNSVPVTLSNENIQDLYIWGRAFTQSTTFLNFNMLLDAKDSSINPGSPIDCLQYRSIYIQYNASGPAGGTTNCNANFLFEASNDLVNWTNTAMFRLDGGSAVGVNETRSFNPVNVAANASFGANLTMRYFRVRCNSFGSNSFIQWTTMLRMTPMLYSVNAYTNIAQIGASGVPTGVSNFNTAIQGISTTGGQVSSAYPFIPQGGTDKSVVKQEMLGAPINPAITAYNFNGPWGRLFTADVAGALNVSGPMPFMAEEKTTPVNVRLERTTKAQDSVQDLLQQVLLELKALNHYTREAPLALATNNFSSMKDEVVDFANDKTLYN